MKLAESGAFGFASVSGIQLDLRKPIPKNDNQLISVRLSNGKHLKPNRIYTLAMSDFLVTGGDGLGRAMAKIPKNRITMDNGPTVRDAVVRYIMRNGPLNPLNHPLVDPHHPRIRLQKSE